MPPERPAWIAKDLSSILGLDEQSIKEMIIPDLESYTHETRLRIHLQDFLGSSPPAKSFISKYTALRFRSLASSVSAPTATPAASASSGSSFLKPQGKIPPQTHTPSASSSRGPSRPASTAPPAKANGLGDSAALQAAFGPGGKVYQKNRDADESSFLGLGSRSTSQAGGSRSPLVASGAQTPSSPAPGQTQRSRQAGAVNISVQPPKPQTQQQQQNQRIDQGGLGSRSGSAGAGAKGKGRAGAGAGAEKIWDREKSKEVKRLEGVVERLRIVKEGEGKVRDDGLKCFCQARIHPLSTYTPICQSCGLTICTLHAPHLPCPSCAHPLYTPAQLARLILRLEEEVEAQLLREERQREQAERERLERLAAEAGGGAFPTLPGGHGGSTASAVVQGGGGGGARKVLTIGAAGKGKGKGKTTITTTTYHPATPSASASNSKTASRAPTPPPSDLVPRPRASPVQIGKTEKGLTKLINWREENDRPWGELKAVQKGEGWTYKDLEVVVLQVERHVGRRKAARGKRGEGGREIPGAA